ncbi:hypothetical protein BH11ACT3_BH11ACT3_22500 [soil metagenome]
MTTPLRTALDLCGSLSLVGCVAILDAVVQRAYVADVPNLAAEVGRRRPFRGVRRIDAALEHVTGRAESALESLSLVRFAELGFPTPRQQVEFVTEGIVDRVDFYWPDFRIIGESDGDLKYDDENDPQRIALRREKRREDRLRSRVRGFARWGWHDAWHPRVLEQRLLASGLPRERVGVPKTR